MKMRRVKENPFTIIIACFMVITFVAYLFRAEPVFSVSENRYLAGRPGVTLQGLADGSFMESFELYVKEQLPLRDNLIKLKALAGQAQLKNENNGIAEGKDGFLFEKLVSINPQLDKNEAAIINFAKGTDRNINVCIIPNSFEILPDKVPAGFPNISEKAWTGDFYKRLEGLTNTKTIDMYDTLREHKDEYIYYRTDHHWTTQGAYYGYLKLCADMGLDPVKTEDLQDVRRDVDGFYGTYYSKYKGAGIEPDVLTYYDIEVESYKAGKNDYASMYDTDKLGIYDKYAMFMHGNEGLSIVDCKENGRDGLHNAESSKRDELIIFKDSYSNCLIPFLTYNYDRISVVDLRYYPEPVSDFLKEKPDADILLICNFMHFNEDNHFYRLTS